MQVQLFIFQGKQATLCAVCASMRSSTAESDVLDLEDNGHGVDHNVDNSIRRTTSMKAMVRRRHAISVAEFFRINNSTSMYESPSQLQHCNGTRGLIEAERAR